MTLKDEQLDCMHHLGNSLRRVRLGGNICLSPCAIATFLLKAGRNLQELDLAGCQINDTVRSVVVFSLNFCVPVLFNYPFLNLLSLLPWHSMQRCHSAKYLNTAILAIHTQVVQAVATHCKNLQELSLGYADNYGGVAGGGVTLFGWGLLMRNLKKIHTLKLKRCVPPSFFILPAAYVEYTTAQLLHNSCSFLFLGFVLGCQ